MPLVLTRNPALLELQPLAKEAEANDPPVISTYTPNVERWRKQAWDQMPPQLRARPDAGVLLDKALYVIDGESSGRPDAVGDGGAAWGLAQSHHIPSGSDASTQIADMWRMVSNNPEQWTDWGEGSTYQGQPFGALGRSPYGGGGTVTQGGTFGEKVSDGGRAASWFQQARDNVVAKAAQAQQEQTPDYTSGIGVRPIETQQQISPPDTGEAGLMVAPSIANPGMGDQPLDTGDVPYASGQGLQGTYQENAGTAGNAAAPTADEVMQQAGIGGGGVLPNLRDVGNAALGTIPGVGAYQARDALTQPFGGVVKQAGSLLEEGGKLGSRALALQQALSSGGYSKAPGQEQMGRYSPGPAEAVGGYAGSTIVPQTPLDTALTFAGEVLPAARAIKAGAPVLPTIARGAIGGLLPGVGGLNDEAARGAEGARGVAANIIGDAASVRAKAAKAAEMLATLRQAGHTDAEIEAALPGAIALAEGGTASQRAAQTLPNLTGEAQSSAARTAYERASTGEGVLYHGTPNVSVTKPTVEGGRLGGITFAENPDVAKAYAGPSGKVIPSRIKSGAKIIDATGTMDNENWHYLTDAEWRRLKTIQGKHGADLFEAAGYGPSRDLPAGQTPAWETLVDAGAGGFGGSPKLAAVLREMGYDGIKTYDAAIGVAGDLGQRGLGGRVKLPPGDHPITVVFNPDAVTTATAEARKAAAVEQEATTGLRGRASQMAERAAPDVGDGIVRGRGGEAIADLAQAGPDPVIKPGSKIYRGQPVGQTEGLGGVRFSTTDRKGAEWYQIERSYGPASQTRVPTEIAEGAFKGKKPAALRDLVAAIKETGATADEVAKLTPYEGDNILDFLYVPEVRTALARRGFDSFVGWDVLENREIPTVVEWSKQGLRGRAGALSERIGTPRGAAGIMGDSGGYSSDVERLAFGDAGQTAAAPGERTLAHEADALDAAYGASTPGSGGLLRVARDLGDPAAAARDLYKRSGQNQAVEGDSGGKRRTPEENAALRAARTAGPADIRGAAKEERAARAAEPAARRAEAQAAKAAAEEARLAEIERLRKENAPAVQANRGAIEEGLQMAGTKAPEDIADTAAGAGGDMFTDAAKAEREAAAKAAEMEKRAEQVAVETHQSKVEAMDLERRKQAWLDKQAAEKALAEAKGYHSGGIGQEIVGLLGLPRALSLSSDIGTARDLGLFVGTKQGRQALARGGAAGLRSVIQSDAEAQAVIEAAQKGSRWYDWAADAKNLPGERPVHSYEFGAGASAESRVPEMSGLNQSRISQTVEKWHPGIKFSDRALAVQRNVGGVDLLESRLDELALKYGVSGPEDAAKNARFLSEAQSTIDSVNHLRGYSGGSKAKALGALNVFVSPQQMFSRLQVIGDPLNFMARGDTESAKFAARSLMGFASTQGALLGLARVTGKQSGLWSVNLNPTSSDFGEIKVGNTRIDAMAGLGPTMRLAAKGLSAGTDAFFGTDYAKNQAAFGVLLTRWLENKEGPVSRIITDYTQHNKLPNEQTAINMLAPSIATGFMQSLKEEHGNNKLLAGPTALLNFGGVGTNTYKDAGDIKRETAQDLGLGDYNALPVTDKLKVLANAPKDAPNNFKQEEKQAYEAARKQTPGYSEPEPVPDGGETKSEQRSRELRNEARAKDNAEVYKKNPELDLQRWFFSGADTLASTDAVTQALALNAPDRTVRYSGAARDLNTDQGKQLWQTASKQIADFYDPKTLAAYKEVAEYYAGNRVDKNNQRKTYATLTPEERTAVDASTRTAYREDHPDLDALMAYMGFSGSDNRYLIHSKAAQAPLEALRAKYGRDAPNKDKGYGFALAANAR